MRLRFSTFSCMAAAVLVALDAATLRSLVARPEFLIQELRWLLIATMPMVNLLAVVAYLGRTPGALGFQLGGWAALVATCVWDASIFAAVESVAVATGVDAWIAGNRLLEDVVVFGLIPGFLLAAQLLAATLGWWAAGRFWGRPEWPRSRYAALACLAVAALVPVVFVEATLRSRVDPYIARLEPGSRAVVDYDAAPGSPVRPKPGSPLLALDGHSVRVEADLEANVPEMVASSRGGRSIIRDRRTVKVSPVDGGGESVLVPYCTLRVVR